MSANRTTLLRVRVSDDGRFRYDSLQLLRLRARLVFFLRRCGVAYADIGWLMKFSAQRARAIFVEEDRKRRRPRRRLPRARAGR